MPEESTIRKICMSKTKIVETFTGQSVSDFGTNPSSTLEELNSKKHTPSPTVDFYEITDFAKL